MMSDSDDEFGYHGDGSREGIVCALPFEAAKGWERWTSQQGRCIQGNNTQYTHHGYLRHAFDFKLRRGSQILAARDGVVAHVCDHFREGGACERLLPRSNFVAIRHPQDGTYTRYIHLMPGGVLVCVGQEVRAGQPIALSGNTGFSSVPHLHFDVVNLLPQETSELRLLSPGGVMTIPSVAAIFSGQLSVHGEVAAPLVYLSSATLVTATKAAARAPLVPLVANVVVLIDRGGAGGRQTFAEAAATAAAAVTLSHCCRCVGVIVANNRSGHEVFAMAPPQQEKQGPVRRRGCGGGEGGGGGGGGEFFQMQDPEYDTYCDNDDDDDDDDDDDHGDNYTTAFGCDVSPAVAPGQRHHWQTGVPYHQSYPAYHDGSAVGQQGQQRQQRPFDRCALGGRGLSQPLPLHPALFPPSTMKSYGGDGLGDHTLPAAAAGALGYSSTRHIESKRTSFTSSCPSPSSSYPVQEGNGSIAQLRAPFPVMMVSQESGTWLKEALSAAAEENEEQEREHASERLQQPDLFGRHTVAPSLPRGVIVGISAAENCPVVPSPSSSAGFSSGGGGGDDSREGAWAAAPMLYGAETVPVTFERSGKPRHRLPCYGAHY